MGPRTVSVRLFGRSSRPSLYLTYEKGDETTQCLAPRERSSFISR
jgi:hypothetical protein